MIGLTKVLMWCASMLDRAISLMPQAIRSRWDRFHIEFAMRYAMIVLGRESVPRGFPPANPLSLADVTEAFGTSEKAIDAVRRMWR